MDNYREYVGNLHVHSVYSDGEALHKDIAKIANDAGLDFAIVTDHNVRPDGVEGYYGRTLLLVGEEIHNVRRKPQANHLLVYGIEHEMAPYAFGSAQTLIKTVQDRGGFCFIAHPVEKRSPIKSGLEAIPWVEWPIEGITGLEIWNYMSEFKGLLWSRLAALLYIFRPEWGIRGPNRAILRLWDEMLAKGQRVAVLGGADAHGTRYKIGPIQKPVFSYDYLFRCVNTHVLTHGAFNLELEHDKALLYEALRAGHTWAGYDLAHPTRGFRFSARSGAAAATMGEALKRRGAISLQIQLPARGEIHLIRDGKRIIRTNAAGLQHTTIEPGIYRVEIYRRFRGHKVGWIFSSPIYVA